MAQYVEQVHRDHTRKANTQNKGVMLYSTEVDVQSLANELGVIIEVARCRSGVT